MVKNEYTLVVDVKKKHTALVPTFVQNDTAKLVFKMYDGGMPFDLTGVTKVEVAHKRKDGIIVVGLATFETVNGESIIRYEYLGSEMAVEGFVDTTITIFAGDTQRVSIMPFKVSVVADIRNAVGATQEYGVLKDIIDIATTLIEKANTAKAETIQATAEAKDATAKAKTATTETNTAKDQVLATEADFKVAESKRVSAESSRVIEEGVRNTSEGVRKNSEAERVAQENTRKQSELDRIAAEKERQTNTATAISNAETATTNANTSIANLSHVDTYSIDKQYYKNNIVNYNGSSYMAIKDTKGNTPTNDINDLNWKLVARKGEDGTGLVVLYKETFTATEGQTVFTLEHSYDMNQNRVRVNVGGVEQFYPENFMEQSANSIRFHQPLPVGSIVTVIYFGQAPAIVNDLQLQINTINDLIGYIDVVAIKEAVAHAKMYGDRANVSSQLADEKAGLANLAATNADTQANRAKTETDAMILKKDEMIAEENVRKTAETTRNLAETGRKDAEATRVSTETTRKNAESARVTVESKRVTDENTRTTNETARQSKETERQTSESGRVTEEGKRVTAETNRSTNETGRVNAESKRVTAEQGRVSAESARVTAEQARVTAETKRQTDTSAAITAANTAKDGANTAASKANEWKYMGEWSSTTSYKINNTVTHEGSSYIAIRNNTNVTPVGGASDLDWAMLAKRGEVSPEVDIMISNIEKSVARNPQQEVFTTTTGQTVFNLAGKYTPNQQRINVIIGGVPQYSPLNFTESVDGKKVTIAPGISAGEKVIINYF